MALIGFALREADQFALHAPRRQKVHPGLPGTGPGLAGLGFAQDLNAMVAQVFACCLAVVDIKGQVVTANICVTGYGTLVRSGVLEQFDVRAVGASQITQATQYGAWVDVQVLLHPIIIALQWAQSVDGLSAEYIAKEIHGLL